VALGRRRDLPPALFPQWPGRGRREPPLRPQKHRWFIWRISWFWLQVGEEIDEGEKTSMNEDNSRCSQPVED
jgi:hypothetical protein